MILPPFRMIVLRSPLGPAGATRGEGDAMGGQRHRHVHRARDATGRTRESSVGAPRDECSVRLHGRRKTHDSQCTELQSRLIPRDDHARARPSSNRSLRETPDRRAPRPLLRDAVRHEVLERSIVPVARLRPRRRRAREARRRGDAPPTDARGVRGDHRHPRPRSVGGAESRDRAREPRERTGPGGHARRTMLGVGHAGAVAATRPGLDCATTVEAPFPG